MADQKRPRFKICLLVSILLLMLLVASNVFWLYSAIDQATITGYKDQLISGKEKTIEQLLNTYPHITRGMTKTEVIEVINKLSEKDYFEKEGEFVYGWLIFDFDNDNRLINIREHISN